MEDAFKKLMIDYGVIKESYGIFQHSERIGKSRHDIHGTLESHACDLYARIQECRKVHADNLFLVAVELNNIQNKCLEYYTPLVKESNSIDDCCSDKKKDN